MKEVYVICTGGTIGMADIENPDKPVNFEDEVRSILPKKTDFPHTTFNIYTPLIDSSEMNIANWNNIALDIYNNYEKYDGFVILHGTDTMAYTGSVLSFMLNHLSKPIVITGSQTPLSCIVNDARENLINAIYIAGTYPIKEITIYFNQTLFRANRITKHSTINYNAYISPNYPNLGKVGSTIEINNDLLLKNDAGKQLQITQLKDFDIRFLPLLPNMKPETLSKLIDGADAVIIGSYGDGNLPILDGKFLNVIKEQHDKGVVIINKSQCMHSKTLSHIYGSGKLFEEAGMISADDQTVEALVGKLLYLFTKSPCEQKIKQKMKKNLRGEITTIISDAKQNRYSFYQAPNDSKSEIESVLLKKDSMQGRQKIEEADHVCCIK